MLPSKEEFKRKLLEKRKLALEILELKRQYKETPTSKIKELLIEKNNIYNTTD